QVLAWGLRGLRGAVREPRLELQWGEQSLWTPPIQDMAANPNFPSNTFLLTLVRAARAEGTGPRVWPRVTGLSPQALPEEERLVPPIRLRLWHRAGTGRRLLLGQASVRDLGRYRCHPPCQEQPLTSGNDSHTVVSMPGTARAISAHLRCPLSHPCHIPGVPSPSQLSLALSLPHPRCPQPYSSCPQPVPAVPSLIPAVPLSLRGASFRARLPQPLQTLVFPDPGHSPGQDGSGHRGVSQGLFCIYPVPEEAGAAPAPRCFQRLPPRLPQPCLVRVYVVRAFELSPRDVTGLSDPYVRVALGKKTLGQRDQYVPNTLEPVFGSRMFELTATIPLEKDLRVTIMDHDKVPPDQEIGSTTIDLEDRLLSHFRDRWGGVTERGHPPPQSAGAPRERLALHVLNRCGLVPEHLETRGLQSRARPGLEQGKVQMWVDIFPTSLGPPGPPVNIDPRKAKGYELRCVVWNVRDTDPRDVTLMGLRMSDIYVSGWLDGLPEQRQHTDIHYRSLNGSGAFNWRFVFPFEFLAAEKLCAIRRKERVWSLDETLLKVPPKLILQVWDNDKFKADDLLGILELELTRLPRPARSARLCQVTPSDLPWFSWPWFSLPWFSLPRFSRAWLSRAWLSVARFSMWLSRRWCRAPALQRSPLNLFRRRRAQGWWPCTVQEEGGQRLSGKLELSLELLTAQEAEERPVGKGREEPNKHPTLPKP
ncbi:MYOF protein, partial [Prunella himalayana]|nr:MYOF protein [Prunella himalayana]